MAVSFPLVFLLCVTTVHFSASLVLPITKHAATNQYFTRIGVGTRPESVILLVDLGNPTIWLDCASEPTASQTQTLVQCLSIRCSTGGGGGCSANHTSDESQQSQQPCVVHPINPISKSRGEGELVGDTVTFGAFQHVETTKAITEAVRCEVVEDFLLTCAPRSLLQGLADGARGVFGLGKSSRISPISQIAHKLDLPRKFSLCLPGKGGGVGAMFFAGAFPTRVADQISRSMVYTPLLPGASDDYSFLVKSVKIDGRKLSLPQSPLRAKISSVDRFSRMGSGIYRALLRGFEAAAAAQSLKLARVEKKETGGGVGGLGGIELCYYTNGSGGARVEVDEFPVIDLVLQSEMVKWRITGHNSLVVVGVAEEEVVCLGLVDGGSDMEDDEIVIGAHQMEDRLLQFDLRSGMFGIGSSLLAEGTSCSELSYGGSGDGDGASYPTS